MINDAGKHEVKGEGFLSICPVGSAANIHKYGAR